MSEQMTSSRPYLIRGLYEWIADNDMTPYLLVDAEYPDVLVPHQYIQDGRIVLNVASHAVSHLELADEAVSFDARFGGVSESLYIPTAAVMAIYAMENGQGMVFSQDDDEVPPPEDDGDKPKSSDRPTLTVVK